MTKSFSRALTRAACTLGVIALLAGSAIAAPAGAAEQDQDQSGLIAENRAYENAAFAKAEGITVELFEARRAARKAIAPAAIAINEDTDTFTGSYFTHDKDSYVYHVIVKEGEQVPALDVPKSDVLSVVWSTAPRSKTELKALQLQLSKEIDPLTWETIGFDEDAGELKVALNETANLADMRAKYGDVANFEVTQDDVSLTACTEIDACTPWRGAIYIQSTLAECSYGFTSKGNSGAFLRMISANHCDWINGNAFTWWHNGLEIGTTSLGMSYIGGDYKKVPRAAGSTPRNLVFYNYDQKSYVIDSVPVESSQDVGDPAHFSGEATLGTSGDILCEGCIYTVWGPGCGPGGPFCTITLVGGQLDTNMFGNPVTPRGGDSGGPVFAFGAALGIGNAANGSSLMYSYITRAEDDLSVTICITSSCGL